MAQVAITIPDTIIPRLTTAMRATFPQYASLTDVACFKQVTADYWRGVLAGYEGGQASQQAEATREATIQAAIDQANTDGSGIG